MATTAKLPVEIFGATAEEIEKGIPVIHQVVVSQLAAARQGTHKVKTRAEVSGGGKKPFRQKGTGRARQGSTRAPHMTGGGVVHGPTPRDYSQRTPKKLKAFALRLALSDRANAGHVHITPDFASLKEVSTKAALGVLSKVSDVDTQLVLTTREELDTIKSLRNVPSVHLLYVDQLNTYDVLLNDDIIFTEDAFKEYTATKKEDK